MTQRKAKQLDMFQSENEIKAKNIIKREMLRFKDHPHKLELVYAIIYREALITRSKDRRKVYDLWLKEHSEYNTFIRGR